VRLSNSPNIDAEFGSWCKNRSKNGATRTRFCAHRHPTYWVIAGPGASDRKVKPARAADPQALGGGINADDLRIEAQADHDLAGVVVLRRGSGVPESRGRDALGMARRSASISLISSAFQRSMKATACLISSDIGLSSTTTPPFRSSA
jgi:hypothetical protein